MKNLIAAVLVLLVSISAFAGNDSDEKNGATLVTITGTVIDQATNETLSGVIIELEETGSKTYSGKNGEFTMKELKPGTYTFNVSCISYKEKQVEVTIDNPGAENISVKLESVEP
jgi:outer membrane receptor for ferrienterochelin and colicins